MHIKHLYIFWIYLHRISSGTNTQKSAVKVSKPIDKQSFYDTINTVKDREKFHLTSKGDSLFFVGIKEL